MLTRWQSYDDVRTEMNRLYDEMSRVFDRRGKAGLRVPAGTAYPPINVWEDQDQLFVEAELPGFGLADLEIYVTGENQLNIKGERKPPTVEGAVWHRQERGYGSFNRLFELPWGVDSSQVTARFQHGVLTVTLPKRHDVKPRKIEVSSN
jgi:HSP20 family protein